MIKVIAKPNESIENLLKRFKRKITKSGVLRDFRKHMTFEKPSSIKHKRNVEIAHKQKLQNKKKRYER